MAPKFWIEFRRLTMTFFFDIASAPLDRQTDTIIGSISGVRPTATASEKKKRSFQSWLGEAVDDEDQRHHYRHETNHQPGELLYTALKRRVHLLAGQAAGHLPKYVCAPVAMDDAGGRTASTLVPRKQMFECSMDETFVRESRASVFSTGSDSPVSVAWMMNKSLAGKQAMSPGIMSPADNFTTSPGTS